LKLIVQIETKKKSIDTYIRLSRKWLLGIL